jgi:hypothetical protein
MVSVTMLEVTSQLVYSIGTTNVFALRSRALLYMTPCADPLKYFEYHSSDKITSKPCGWCTGKLVRNVGHHFKQQRRYAKYPYNKTNQMH